MVTTRFTCMRKNHDVNKTVTHSYLIAITMLLKDEKPKNEGSCFDESVPFLLHNIYSPRSLNSITCTNVLYLPIYKLYTMLKCFDILCWKCDQVTYSLVYVGTCAHQRRTDCWMSRQHPRTHHKRAYSQMCRTQDIDRQSLVHRPARMSLRWLSWLSYSTAVHTTNALYLTEPTERKDGTHFVWWV